MSLDNPVAAVVTVLFGVLVIVIMQSVFMLVMMNRNRELRQVQQYQWSIILYLSMHMQVDLHEAPRFERQRAPVIDRGWRRYEWTPSEPSFTQPGRYH